MYEKSSSPSFNGLGRYYGQAESATQEVKAALPVSVAVDALEMKQRVINPQKYIPRAPDIVDWMQARKYLRRPIGSAPKVQPVAKAKGDVYWTPSGPKVSQKPVKEASKAEKVPKPEVVWKPSVSVVRDKPSIDLPPIEMPTEESFKGLGDWNSPKVLLPVLGLILGIFFLYKR